MHVFLCKLLINSYLSFFSFLMTFVFSKSRFCCALRVPMFINSSCKPFLKRNCMNNWYKEGSYRYFSCLHLNFPQQKILKPEKLHRILNKIFTKWFTEKFNQKLTEEPTDFLPQSLREKIYLEDSRFTNIYPAVIIHFCYSTNVFHKALETFQGKYFLKALRLSPKYLQW